MHWRVLVSAAVLVLAVTPVATQPKGCEPDGKIQFICGITSPEDLVPVPRSEWVVASGYIRGGVSLVNTKTFAATQVFPVAKPVERFDRNTYSQCPGPVDPGEKEKLSAHGLAIRPGPDRVHTIYLVHHGFRESIEVFEIDTPAGAADLHLGWLRDRARDGRVQFGDARWPAAGLRRPTPIAASSRPPAPTRPTRARSGNGIRRAGSRSSRAAKATDRTGSRRQPTDDGSTSITGRPGRFSSCRAARSPSSRNSST